MATRNFVPRDNEEGNIGTTLKNWLKGWFKDVFVSNTLTDGANTATIADLKDAVTKKHTQGSDTALGAQAENLDMNTHKIVGVVDPTTDQEAATKKYVDDNAGGDVVEDLTPQLGGDLDMNGHNIAGNSEADIDDAVAKKHTQNSDTDLDATFEATFVKKVDNVNVLADITSSGADIEDAVTKKHTQGSDTALGAQAENLDMNTHKIVGVVDPTTDQEAATKKYVDDNIPSGAVLGNGTVNPTNLLSNGNFEAWSAGTAVAPDGWTLAAGVVARESTIIKLGTYSSKVSNQNGYLRQYIHADNGIDYWQGRKITLSCWVYCTTANRARLEIADGVDTSTSSYHTGGSTWELLTLTHTINASATSVQIWCIIRNGAGDGYFDGAIVVEGESAFAFADKPVTSTRGTFVNGDLTAGVLTITHNKGLITPFTLNLTITDNDQETILPDEVTFLTNTITVDLSSYGALTGTWGYYFI